jgi:CheY-like chemotaxis protein
LRRYGENPDDIDLIVTDLIMPEMGGYELVKRLRVQRAGFPAIYISGYSADNVGSNGESPNPIVQKPFTSAKLLSAVHEALCDAMLEPVPPAEATERKNGHFFEEAPVLVDDAA